MFIPESLFKKEVFIFDFDMTLVDTSKGSAKAYKFAIEHAGGIFKEEELSEYMSEFLDATYFRIADAKISLNEFYSIFYENSHKYIPSMSYFAQEVKDFLYELKNAGKRLAIVTNKDNECVKRVLSYHKIDIQMFEVVITCDCVKKKKPDAEGLLECLKVLNVKKENCLYIGDNNIDVEFAQNASVDSYITNVYKYKD